MIKVGIAGATGYTGLELVRLLLNHTEVEIAVLTSETYPGQSIAEIFPSLAGFIDSKLVPLGPEAADECDFMFLALPHTKAMEWVPRFLEKNRRVIDLSADYRIKSQETYEEWYATKHEHPEFLSEAAYGLPELHRDQIRSARLVANPGCYPTSVILALAPLMTKDWVDLGSIIADSKSGVSGAGRKPSLTTQFSECAESVSAYNLAKHRHGPEIEQELSGLAGQETLISFSPHLMPMTRGLLSTVYIDLKRDIDLDELIFHYHEFYLHEPFVRLLKAGVFANTRFVAHSNYCDIGLQVDARNRRAIITCAIDNLLKGASGQAVQNMNIMLGIDETTALKMPGMVP